MPVTREEVVSAYHYLLNREPESETAVREHQTAADWQQVRRNFMGSEEYRYISGYLDRWIIAPVFDDSLLLWVNMQDKYVSIHCVMNNYEPENSELIRKLLRPGGIFVDLGANVGWFTLLASSIVGPEGHVYSFEPQPSIANYLRRTLTLNDLQSRVSFHQAGVWHQSGSMRLAWADNSENHGASHLMPGDIDASVGTLVDLITLDSLGLKRCDLIKMDIEGAEPRAMQGAEQLLSTCRPVILSELNAGQLAAVTEVKPGDYIRAMDAQGYRCVGARTDRRGQVITADEDLDGIFTDVLFTPVEKLDEILTVLS